MQTTMMKVVDSLLWVARVTSFSGLVDLSSKVVSRVKVSMVEVTTEQVTLSIPASEKSDFEHHAQPYFFCTCDL